MQFFGRISARYLIRTITPQQAQALLMSMSAEDYYQYGYLLDNGASFSQFEPEPEPQQQQAQLPPSNPGSIDEQAKQPKLPTSIVELVKASHLSMLMDAGVLSLVGAQGAGKTSTSLALLHYRIAQKHKFIVINPHKKKNMYLGLEKHFVPGTEFYGIGMGDAARAVSLLKGMDFILAFTSIRYDEYQNLEPNEYDHFPVTILLEECAEYEALLATLNRKPKTLDDDDPGFNAKAYLTQFWLKMFVAIRKGNCFVIRTIQSDTNTTNGTEGFTRYGR